jgi:hypothetical protein
VHSSSCCECAFHLVSTVIAGDCAGSVYVFFSAGLGFLSLPRQRSASAQLAVG